MIILLTGDNFYEIDRELGRIVVEFDGEAEQLDADSLDPRNLTDIFSGVSLFSANRLVVIKRLNENTTVWEGLARWLDKPSDTTLVLVEPKVDKRTKSYKALAKQADVRVFTAWTERDALKAEKWLLDTASSDGIALSRDAAREIVVRRGTEQYQLLNTLRQLAVLGEVSREVVEAHIETTPHENVFELLAASLAGDASNVRAMIRTLRLENDPYMTVGLLASQTFALAGIVLSGKSQSEIASDLSVSPYVLRNLAGLAAGVDRTKLKVVVESLAIADIGLKSSSVDPWLQIEIALTK
ncbi:DNA polymerase III subunit delta [Candidatus Saccharibacteria bacterium]|nr:DNA polymerase III subunit delta [Candidatus Saccharibacteria bacterium]